MNAPFNMLTNVHSQQKRLLEYLSEHPEGINRYQAEDKLNICHLAPRIIELSELGYIFSKVKETALDHKDRPHHGISRYFLIGFKEPEKAVNHEEVV